MVIMVLSGKTSDGIRGSLVPKNVRMINCVFYLKPSPALEAPGHGHQLDQTHGCKTWAYPTNTVLATVAFLLLLDASLLSQMDITHYSQLLTLQHSTKLFLS